MLTIFRGNFKHQYLPHYSIVFSKKLQTESVEPTEHFGIYFGYIRWLFRSWVSPFNPRPHILFRQTRTHLGGGGVATTHAISLLSVIELRDNDQRIVWDVPNPMVWELTHLGQPLTFQVRSNKNAPFSGTSISSSFSSITSSLFEIERWFCHHRLSLVKADRLIHTGNSITLTQGDFF